MFQIGAAAQVLDLDSGILAHAGPSPADVDTGCEPPAWRRPCDGRGRRRSPDAVGWACPKRSTLRRSVRPFTSALSTRRTALRSSDHRCRMHLPSPDTEYFAVANSNSNSPSSMATAWGASARNCSRSLARCCGRDGAVLHVERRFWFSRCDLQVLHGRVFHSSFSRYPRTLLFQALVRPTTASSRTPPAAKPYPDLFFTQRVIQLDGDRTRLRAQLCVIIKGSDSAVSRVFCGGRTSN